MGIQVNPANADVDLLNSFTLALGYRYYFNSNDLVKFFFSNQIVSSLVDLAFGLKSTSGFQWDFINKAAIFVQLEAMFGTDLVTKYMARVTPSLGFIWRF